MAQAIQINRMVLRQKEELLEENAQLRAQVRAEIAKAADRSNRNIDDIELVAISKTHPAERVREAAEAGSAKTASMPATASPVLVSANLPMLINVSPCFFVSGLPAASRWP